MSVTLGAAVMAGVKGIVGIISSLTIPQALAVGTFVGGIAYTLYVKIKSSKKICKKAHEASTVTQKVADDYDKRKHGKTSVDVDRLDRDMDDIRTRDERETDRIYKDILDEIDADNQVRNRGRKHKYSKKNAKRDFAAVDKMKKRAKKRREGSFARTIEEEIEKFYRDVEDISRAEEDKKFDRYVGEEDDMSRKSQSIFDQDFAALLAND